ncbi:MAG: site-2 protease family protein [Clostridia bacterium]|nr:site-2 protease family protein [Clostridia bacterium]
MFLTVIHEFGHFIAAKAFKIKVTEFAIGMGPLIFKKQGKETLYSLRLFPIGGFCKMEGEEEYSESPRSFSAAKVWKRFIVVVSGAAMNLLLGFIAVVVTVSCFYNLVPTTMVAKFNTLNIPGYEQEVPPVSNAEGGLMQYDRIIKINGEAVTIRSDINYILGLCQDETVDITVLRDMNPDEDVTELKEIVLEDVKFHQIEQNGSKGLIADFSVYGVEKTVGNVLDYSFKETVGSVKMVYRTLAGLITGKIPVSNMSSIVGVGGAINDSVSQAESVSDVVFMLLSYLYLISINLGVMNLLPFPALDGGHVVFLIYEAIFKKPVPEKLYTILNAAGFILLFAFMIFIVLKDVFYLFV